MSNIPDGNTAALRQHTAAEDRAQERHDAYGERAIQSIIDDLFEGKKVIGLTLHDFADEVETDAIVALLCATGKDDQMARIGSIRGAVEARIRRWCDHPLSTAADEVNERVRVLCEDAQTRHGEEPA